MKKNINILISIDDNYVSHAIDLIYSIVSNNNVSLDMYLIYGDKLSDESINILKMYLINNNYGMLYPIYYEGDQSIFPMNCDYISVTTYLRLFAPFLLPEEVDKILYLDCDIICNGSILKLYNMKFDNNTLIGCRNMIPMRLKKWSIRNNLRLGLDPNYKYINAGVLMIDVNRYRKNISVDNIFNIISEYREYLLFQDQDIINKLFCSDIKVVSNKYNYQVNPGGNDIDYSDIVFIHFSEKDKPWNKDFKNLKKGISYYKLLKNMGREDEMLELLDEQLNNIKNSILDDINNF